MKNITFAVEDDVLDRVRVIAAQKKTTVNAMVREFLTELADETTRRERARQALLDLIDNSTADIGPNYVWNREELYEDRLFPRHERADLRDDGEKE